MQGENPPLQQISAQISTNLAALSVARSKRDYPLIKLTYFWLPQISTLLLTRRAGLAGAHHITKLIIHLDDWEQNPKRQKDTGG